MPLRPAALDSVLAAVTVQRVWRAITTRMRLCPSITRRVLRLRAAVTMQRWWRWWLFKERICMLITVRQRVVAASNNKLYLPTSVYEELGGQLPMHKAALWPEHTAFEFTFANTPESPLQYLVEQGSLRQQLPQWCAPTVPIGVSRAFAQPQEPLSLLSMGVTAALAPRKSFGPFVKRDWTVVAFHSTVEAARRSALLTAIGYEPLAMRTRHGRLQGMLMQPLQLLNHAEVTQHEAAAAIQVPPPPVHLQRPHAPGG